MKKHYIIIALLLSFGIKAQIVNIPDSGFKTKLLLSSATVSIAKNQNGVRIKIDANNDGEVQETEAASVYWLNVNHSNIADMTGISAFVNLNTLICNNNELVSLDVSMLPMEELITSNNNLTSLNITGLTNLHILDYGNNYLPAIDLSGSPNLTQLLCTNNNLTMLNVSGLTQLVILNCTRNELTSLNLTGLTLLQNIDCSENNITSLDFSGLSLLEDINCSINNITTLNLSGLNHLEQADCSENNINSIITGNNTAHTLTVNNNNLVSLDVTNMPGLKYLYCNNNLLTTVNVAGMPLLKRLECSHNNLSSINLSGLPVLEWLLCFNNVLPSIDLSGCPGLLVFNCSFNSMTTLDVTPQPLLEALGCKSNLLTTLNVTGMGYLQSIDCSHNQLSYVDLTGTNPGSDYICSYNLFTDLDFTDKSLDLLDCSFNPLTSLKVGDVEQIYCQNTLVSTLSFPYKVWYLNINNNLNLQSLFFKNNEEDLMDFQAHNIPNLTYMCLDEVDIPNLQYWITDNGELDDVEINNYCTFTPGDFYDINVVQKYDADINGCGAGDNPAANLHFDITNGTVSGTIYGNGSGNYHIPVQTGSHTITPVFDNPYFSVSPTSVTITIPGAPLPITQAFCITPSGVHADVEIALFNTDAGVPGFDSHYRIIYKNKGTTTASGMISLSFDDAVLDFITANPVTNSQSAGLLSWNYSGLQPFETRTIDFTLNLNSPVETPPLNQDDILQFAATISLASDVTPSDNTALLQQTVFNALDPNDKTCLEGDTITPDMIGEYVHYKIRFENTGNYPAAIVTVKDVIDTSKFDISTLTPITASHPFITRITNTNQVEFIFDNIMLPFDDANNDGYVIFKIKTKPTLVLGDELSNTAGIYFNYNAPVITNTAVTTVALPLGIDENNNAFGFALYPNPVKDVLNISSKVNADIDSLIIYNTLGQEVMKVLPASGERKIDVSKLSGGHYVIKIISAGSAWTSQFIKE